MKPELNSKELIEHYKKIYKEFTSTFCPFLDDKVLFTMKGFKHLIWKRESGKRDYIEIKKPSN